MRIGISLSYLTSDSIYELSVPLTPRWCVHLNCTKQSILHKGSRPTKNHTFLADMSAKALCPPYTLTDICTKMCVFFMYNKNIGF